MNVLGLFSGIGAFELGLERAGMTIAAMCEIDPYCRRILAEHWPTVPVYEDIRAITAERLRADGIAVDVLCGGFPCQDISIAGSRAGLDGERSGLWLEYLRLIGELGPRYAVMENSAALLDGQLCRILGKLAEIRYDAEWHAISAAHVGAPHERDRVWLVAYPNAINGEAGLGIFSDHQAAILEAQDRNRASIWLAPPAMPPRVGDGSADWLDRRERTEVIGNAVVPQIPEIIGRAIHRRLRP